MVNRDDRAQGRYRAVVLAVAVTVVSAACDPTAGGSLPAEFPVVSSAVRPNDSRFSEQWALPLLSAPEAWGVIETPALAGQFRPTVVAVLDSMIDLDHPDLAGNVAVADGWDFIENRRFTGSGENPNRPDIDHGTHVAGIIAAVHNGVGVAGLGHKFLKVMPIRVLRDGQPRRDGRRGRPGTGRFSDLYSAMRYAAGLPNETGALPSRPAKVINLSLGSPRSPSASFSMLFVEMVAQLNRIGVVIVAASGNSGTMRPTYPAAYPGVLSVGSVDADRRVSRFSNGGPTLDFVAPGGALRERGVRPRGILSTVYEPTPGQPRYDHNRGTSMAAPYVAAIAALILAYEPKLSADDVYRILAETSQDLGIPGRDTLYGWGLVNADRALRRAMMVPFGRYRIDTAVLTGPIGSLDPSPVVTDLDLAVSPAAGAATADPIPGVYLVTSRAEGAEARAAMAALADRLGALESTDLGGGLWRLRVAPHTTDATVQEVLATSDLVDFVGADHSIVHLGEPVETVVPFELVYDGTRSGVATRGERLYTTVAALQSEPWFTRLPTEARDRALQWVRSGRSVAALFAGSRPTGGYHVQIERVTAEDDRLRIRYRVLGPDPGLIVTQALTSPYVVVLVDGAFSAIEALPLR